MAQPSENNGSVNVHIKTEEPDVEGDLNMADLQPNPANEENSGGVQAMSGNTSSGGVGGGAGGGGDPLVLSGVGDPGLHAPPVPRKDKNLREFLAAMDEYAPIVRTLLPLLNISLVVLELLRLTLIGCWLDPRRSDRLLPRPFRPLHIRHPIKTTPSPCYAEIYL